MAKKSLLFGVYKCIIILLLYYVHRDVSIADGISEEAFAYLLDAGNWYGQSLYQFFKEKTENFRYEIGFCASYLIGEESMES